MTYSDAVWGNVPKDYYWRNASVAMHTPDDADGPPVAADLVYVTVHAGQGGTLWNYRLPGT